LSKRAAGLILIGCGALIVLGILAVDVFGIGRWEGIGPAQRLAIGVGALVSLIGATLVPLGDRLA
jgi:hypothetical protein